MEGFTKQEGAVTEAIEQESLPIEKLEDSAFSRGFFLTLKNKLLDSLEPVLMVVDNGLKEGLADSAVTREKIGLIRDLSDQTGDFFEGLIPKGSHKSEINQGAKRNIRENEIRKKDDPSTKGISYMISKRKYRIEKEERLRESIYRENRTPFAGNLSEKVVEGEPNHEVLRQETTRALLQEGGENLIYEMVVNDLSPDQNQAQASLVIQNIKDGTSLDLNALLPYQYKFVPSFMDRESVYVDKTSEDRKDWAVRQKWDSVANLKDYLKDGTNEGRFVVRPGYERVEYGDLTKSGSLIALFHEITHSWQQAYFGKDLEKGGSVFKKFFPKVQEHCTQIIKAYVEAGKTTDDETFQKVLTDIKSELGAIGVEFCKNPDGSDILLSPLQLKGEDIINIQAPWNELFKEDATTPPGYFPIKSPRLRKVMDSYIAEERDAWAHALRTMRFLRSKGFDVEPGLKTLADIKAYIAPCLESYQNSASNLVAMEKGDYRFARLD